jgi:Fur family transcriptional regulator, ferric uptake regulator
MSRLIRNNTRTGSIGRWHDRHVPIDHGHDHVPGSGPEALRSHGRRLTRQRQAIWDALTAEPDTHLSADEIVERVRLGLPDVNPSTVYRTLDLLVDEGLVVRSELGGDRAYYEPATEHAHHHVVCERCGAVVHVHDDVFRYLGRRVEKASGYELGSRPITLFGVCPACRG